MYILYFANTVECISMLSNMRQFQQFYNLFDLFIITSDFSPYKNSNNNVNVLFFSFNTLASFIQCSCVHGLAGKLLCFLDLEFTKWKVAHRYAFLYDEKKDFGI